MVAVYFWYRWSPLKKQGVIEPEITYDESDKLCTCVAGTLTTF